MSAIGFRTRKHGTIRQIGTKFPVLQKKKLPAKISIQHIIKSKWPTLSNKESGISNISYNPPSDKEDGFISFTFLGKKLSAAIRVVDKEDSIGQWSVNDPAVVFLDKKIGIGFIKYLSLHERGERYLDRALGIPWQPFAHALMEELEHREFRKSHPESEWAMYSWQVKQVSHMNEGGKVSSRANLEKAFDMLHQRQRALKWQERGLSDILEEQTDRRELAGFQKQLKRSIDKHLE